jgi:flagellar P-ring protein precursor FlgI
MTDALNRMLGPASAQAMDAVSVKVQAPTDPASRVAFIGALQEMEVDPSDAPAKVIVNSRTGTVVISSRVRVSPAAVAHGSLTVTIQERTEVSQPLPFSKGGTTVEVPRSTINVTQADARMFVFDAGVNLDEIVRAVNQVGAAPGDLVAILEALQQCGALRAQLIVI